MNEVISQLISRVESMSAPEQVYFINRIFGNSFGDNPANAIIDQTMNIYDEADEFKQDGLWANNKKEMVDAIGDLLTFGYGVAYLRGIDVSKIQSIPTTTSDMNNAEAIDSVINLTDVFINEFKQKRDIDESYAKLMGMIKYLCDINDVDEKVLMTRITNSNLTKICATFEECQETINNYVNKGIEVYSKYFEIEGSWIHVVYSSKEQKDNAGKVYRANKFLKCIHFKEPVLDDLV